MVVSKESFYITPAKLHGNKKFPFRCDFAFICYCPMPEIFKRYESMVDLGVRYFVHSHPMHVIFCRCDSYNFVVVSEVYGGPVSVTTVEELHHYGVRKIIGIGFVGSFNDKILIGDNVMALQSMADVVGTTPFYESIEQNESNFNYNVYPTIWPECDNKFNIKGVGIWTTNAFYRETKEQVEVAKTMGCDCVNMDTSHLYAACNELNIGCTYYATVSDTLKEHDKCENEWDNGLNDALSKEPENSIVLINQCKLIEYLINQHAMDTLHCTPYIIAFESFMKSQQICKSHDFSHACAVMENARMAIINEPLTLYQKEAILLAALLHDADDKKFFPNNKNYENMRQILFDKNQQFVDLVAEMIDLVSCSVNGDRMVEEEWKLIPRYADRLEALGVIGIKRCYEYTKTVNNPLILPDTLCPTNIEQLWTIASVARYKAYNGKSRSMIDHYYDKLLRLGDFPIKNEVLKQRAQSQINVMAMFVLEFCKYYLLLCQKYNDISHINYDLNIFVNQYIDHYSSNHQHQGLL